MVDKDKPSATVLETATFAFLKRFFEHHHMTEMQIESFDCFLNSRLQKTVEEEPEIRIKLGKDEYYHVQFGQVFVDRPYILDENRTVRYITPKEARLRELTYSSVVSVDVVASHLRWSGDGETAPVVLSEKRYHRLPICRMPMMVMSSMCNLREMSKEERERQGECRFDLGGYFIIRGKERVIIAQERINYNIVYCFEPKQNSKSIVNAEIRSMSDETGHSVFVQMKLLVDYKLVMNIPYITHDIPLGCVCRAYGCTMEDMRHLTRALSESVKCKMVYHYLMYDYLMYDSEEDACRFICQHVSYNITKERRQKYVQQILYNEIFPHLGITSTTVQKVLFIGHMLNRIIDVYTGRCKMDDRDHINNKRIETSGVLIGDLFRTLYKRMIRSIEPHLVKRPDISIILTRTNSITLGLKHCFSTGNWGIPKSNYIRTGVSQVLSRLTFNSTLSHLRRCLIPIGKEGKNTKIRQVHPSQIGYICAHETPEGHSAGIVKNFSVSCKVTRTLCPIVVRQILETLPHLVPVYGMRSVSEMIPSCWKLMINGWWGYIIPDVHVTEVLEKLTRYKDDGRLPRMVSVSRSEVLREIHVYSDEGRMIRPLWDARKLPTVEMMRSPSVTVDEMEDKGYMVWVDSYEMETCVIATEWVQCHEAPKGLYTHVEIHPSLIMGVCVGIIPYPDHTQSPRLCYQASMGKQAIGVYATTNAVRNDTIAHVLVNPERPIVRTHLSDWIGYNSIPSGNNLILAIACYSGFNQEDSVIFNQSSIDRGVFRSYAYRCILVEEKKKSSNSTETIRLPPENIRNRGYNYTKLDKNGIIRMGVYVGPGDILVSKVCERTHKTGQVDIVDQSCVVKNGEDGVVDTVYVTTSPDGYRMVRVKVRSLKIMEMGDKVATRNGQKGTVGITLRQEDMPFSASGIVPDIIMNPHAIPSRMTINQLLECVGAKSSAIKGKLRYCTAFSSHSTDIVDTLCNELKECGFERHGNERLYNGMTGELMDAQIFMGPTYYQRLKHLVASKIHARNFGNIQTLFRQPCEGRSKDGGLRFGEMERDCSWENTSVSLKCGLSVRIKDLENNDMEVLGWDVNTNGMIPCAQIGFLAKGMKECVRVTLQDGRSLICTPEHPVLTSLSEWVPAQCLAEGNRRVRCSVDYPTLDIDEEIKECNGWCLEIATFTLRTGTRRDLLKSFAFARVVGMLITDGCISVSPSGSYSGHVTFGHMMDVHTFWDDLTLLCLPSSKFTVRQESKYGCYIVPIPAYLLHVIVCIPGILIGKKLCQQSTLPQFILDENCPRPIIREFLGSMFGGDGHTCILGMHRGKRDVLTSISFSKSRVQSQVQSLVAMMNQIVCLLNKCGIHKITIQELKETSNSKTKRKADPSIEPSYQSTLHLDISEVIPFHDRIGFRHCSHKTVRLEAAVAYRRLRENVIRQHNWIVQRVDEITHFSEIKKQNPTKIVGTKKAIAQAIQELQKVEPLVHDYAIPTTHDITDHLIKGTEFGKFTSKSFPTAEDFLKEIGAYSWFVDDDSPKTAYGTPRSNLSIPTMDLKVLDVRPCGEKIVYDIQVAKTESFLADGIVAHNCMISHGVSRFLLERLYDMSDPFQMTVCTSCGMPPRTMDRCDVCDDDAQDLCKVQIPYACKLLFQELNAMGIRTQIFPSAGGTHGVPQIIEHLPGDVRLPQSIHGPTTTAFPT